MDQIKHKGDYQNEKQQIDGGENYGSEGIKETEEGIRG